MIRDLKLHLHVLKSNERYPQKEQTGSLLTHKEKAENFGRFPAGFVFKVQMKAILPINFVLKQNSNVFKRC